MMMMIPNRSRFENCAYRGAILLLRQKKMHRVFHGEFVGDGSGLVNVGAATSLSGHNGGNVATYPSNGNVVAAGIVTARAFVGDGSGLSNISGLGSGSPLVANVVNANSAMFQGTVRGGTFVGTFVGDGSGLSGVPIYSAGSDNHGFTILDTSNIINLTNYAALNGATFAGAVYAPQVTIGVDLIVGQDQYGTVIDNVPNAGNVWAGGVVKAAAFVGDGSGLGFPVGLSANIVTANSFIGSGFSANVVTANAATFAGTCTANSFVGDGSRLSNIVFQGNVLIGVLSNPIGHDAPGIIVEANTNQSLVGSWSENAMFLAHVSPTAIRRCFQVVQNGTFNGQYITSNPNVTFYVDGNGQATVFRTAPIDPPGVRVFASSYQAASVINNAMFLAHVAILPLQGVRRCFQVCEGGNFVNETCVLTDTTVGGAGPAKTRFFVDNHGQIVANVDVSNGYSQLALYADSTARGVIFRTDGVTMRFLPTNPPTSTAGPTVWDATLVNALTLDLTTGLVTMGNGLSTPSLMNGSTGAPLSVTGDVWLTPPTTAAAAATTANVILRNDGGAFYVLPAVYGSTTWNSSTVGCFKIDLATGTVFMNNTVNVGTSTTTASSFPLRVTGSFNMNGSGAAAFLNSSGGGMTTQNPVTNQPISIYADGGIMIGGGNYWIASDERIKHDVRVEDTSTYPDMVRAAKLVAYDDGSSSSSSAGRKYGFVAQQIANVVVGGATITSVREVPTIMTDAIIVAPGNTFVLENEEHIAQLRHPNCVGKVHIITSSSSAVAANIVSISPTTSDVTVDVDLGPVGGTTFVIGPVVDDFLSLNYDRMWHVCFGAVQELVGERDSARRQFAQLRRRLDVLERFLGFET